MNTLKQLLISQKYILLLSGILFILIFGINHYFPIILDDWSYSIKPDGGRYDNLCDILVNQYNHYFEWGGRSIVHVIAQILLAIGVFWGDVVNSIGYVLLVWVIYGITNQNNKANIPLFIGINLSIWFLTPSLVENVFWIVGSANYMWGSLIIFFFLSYYCRSFINNESKDSNAKRTAMFFLGVMAGWTNENMAVALIFFIVCLLLYIRWQKLNCPVWMITGLLGAVVGCAVMLAAPGNYVRNSLVVNELMGEGEPLYMFYFYRFTNILKLASVYVLIPSIIYIIIFAVYLKYKKVLAQRRRILHLSALFIIMSIVATLAMVVSPIFPERVWFAILLLILIATGLLFAHLDFDRLLIKIPVYIVVAISSIVFLYSYWLGFNEMKRLSTFWEQRAAIIAEQKDKGEKDIVLYGKFKASDKCLVIPKMGDIPLDTNEWMQSSYGKYMGVNTVKVIENE